MPWERYGNFKKTDPSDQPAPRRDGYNNLSDPNSPSNLIEYIELIRCGYGYNITIKFGFFPTINSEDQRNEEIDTIQRTYRASGLKRGIPDSFLQRGLFHIGPAENIAKVIQIVDAVHPLEDEIKTEIAELLSITPILTPTGHTAKVAENGSAFFALAASGGNGLNTSTPDQPRDPPSPY